MEPVRRGLALTADTQSGGPLLLSCSSAFFGVSYSISFIAAFNFSFNLNMKWLWLWRIYGEKSLSRCAITPHCCVRLEKFLN